MVYSANNAINASDPNAWDYYQKTGISPDDINANANTETAKNKRYNELNKSGWMTDTYNPGATGGIPMYEQAKDWITNYIDQYNRKPTTTEYGNWVNKQDRSALTYNPGTAMYEMGFRNPTEYSRAQSQNLTYGPNTGSLVPQGTFVATDSKGNPTYRYEDAESGTARGFLNRGDYYAPDDVSKGFGNIDYGYTPSKQQYGNVQQSDVYPTLPEMPKFNPNDYNAPSQEEAISAIGGDKIYTAQLQDYLSSMANDMEQYVNSLETGDYANVGRLAGALQNKYNLPASKIPTGNGVSYLALSGIQNADDATNYIGNIYNNAISKLGTGDNLPMQNELMSGNWGASAKSMIDQWLQQNTLSPTDYYNQWQTDVNAPAQQRLSTAATGAGAPAQKSAYYNDTDRVTFQNFITGNKFSPQTQQWLTQNYDNLIAQWMRTDKSLPFTQWLIQIARGK